MGRHTQKIDFFNDDNNTISHKNSKHMSSKKSKRVTNESTDLPKRRGRRPKKIINEDTDESEHSDPVSETPEDPEGSTKDDSAVILRLKLNPSKLNNIRMTDRNATPHEMVPVFSENETDGMFVNDIPIDTICHKCAKYEKTINILKQKLEKYEKKDQVDKHTKLHHNHINFIDHKSGDKMVLRKTSLKCLWDGHPFTNIPFPLPEVYHGNAYHVNGCFCSIDCALAYNLYVLKDSKIYQRKSLAIKLYRDLYDIPPTVEVNVKEAPPREVLEDYGGYVSIEQFRKSFHLLTKEYITYIPPMKPLSSIIEEQNIVNDVNASDKQYVLKRSKPLTKKRSIVSSMGLNVEEDDD